MMEMAAFAEESFDAKAWVNVACKSRHPDEDPERHLADLEMKLQLAAEGIAASLEEQSAGALLRVPRALRDVSRLHDDAITLRSSVSGMLLKLKQAEGTSAESVSALARVDSVKQRMEAAHKTLKDAAGLAQLCASVEAVFASGDLPQAAETLANMRRCLAVVGEVPEFASVKRDLETLEDRLDVMVQPRLSDALSLRKVETVQQLRDILITIGRYNSLEMHYTKNRMKPLRRHWDEFDSSKSLSMSPVDDSTPAATITFFPEWLPHFYDEVLLVLEQELKWCCIGFPEDYKLLVPKLLVEIMRAICTSFIDRIETASKEVIMGQTFASPLGVILFLHNLTGAFSRNVQHLFSSVGVRQLADLLRAVYAPYETYKQRYGELEHAQLMSEVGSLDLRGAVQRPAGSRGVELSETVQRMETSIPQVTSFLEAAVERCFSFTGGSEVEALLRTLDDVMVHYTSQLQQVLKSLRPVCGVSGARKDGSSDTPSIKKSGGGHTIPEEEEWAIVQGALQLLAVADNLTGRSTVFEASLRSSIGRLSYQLTAAMTVDAKFDETFAKMSELDINIVRVADLPDKARRLSSLTQQATDPRFRALTHTCQRVGAFSEAVNDLVYEVLISKVRVRLSDVVEMPVWNAVEEENVYGLPSFSAYPQPYITSIGEYLLTLPQQLEPITSGVGGASTGTSSTNESSEDSQYFATEWMFKVAEGATALFIQQIRCITVLSDKGAQQLSADIEYLSNVLAALSMSVPPVLTTYGRYVSASKKELADIISSSSSSSSSDIDMDTMHLICKMRSVPMNE